VEKFLTSSRNRVLLLLCFIGLILTAGGIFFFKSGLNFSGTKVEVINPSGSLTSPNSLTVEISGEVMSPGVYKLPAGSRVDDLLTVAGGFSGKADRVWSDKYLNRAALLTDGQKVYIPNVNQQSTSLTANKSVGDQTVSSTFSSDSNSLININTASLSQLDSLPGIGQVYGQNIIEHRPYSTTQELVSKGAIKQNLFDKIKDKISIY
jgi:competence protein ComEA